MRVANCKKCRERIFKEAEEAFLKQQYAVFKDMAYTFTVLATVAALSTFYRKRRTPEYIRKVSTECVRCTTSLKFSEKNCSSVK